MHKLIKPLFWTFLFLVMMLAIDQFLVQVPPINPAHEAVVSFYRDFRGRLIDLAFGEKKAPPKSIEAVIEKQQKEDPAKQGLKSQAKKPTTPTTQPQGKKQRYIYSDGKGELHFADSLEEVPNKYRGQAQPMGQ